MFTRNELPEDYAPYSELNVCSNELLGGGLAFAIEGKVPLLIGKNDGPRIWLAGPEHPTKREWIVLVADNQVSEEAELLELKKPEPAQVQIDLQDARLLDVVEKSEERASITALDLRPIGLNIYGTQYGLNIGENIFKGNSFKNVGVAFGIGGGPDVPVSQD